MTHMEPGGATSDLHSHFGQRPTMTSSLRPHKTRSGRTKYRIPATPSFTFSSTSVLISGIRVRVFRRSNEFIFIYGRYLRRPSPMYLITTTHRLCDIHADAFGM